MDHISWPEAGPSRSRTAHHTPSHQDDDVSPRRQRHRRRTSSRIPPPTITSPNPPPTTPCCRRPPRKPGLLIPLLLLPLAAAAPPPIVPPQSIAQLTPREAAIRGNFRRETRRSDLPDGIPTDVQLVEETTLPFILERDEQGVWSKSSQGWKLYGRASGVTSNVDAVTNETSEFAVEQSLPKGWGRTTDRTSVYKVPLIAAASLILALAIVAAIIILAFNRRKAHRRAKRRAERARRKALAAAGYTDDQNSSVYDSALRAHLDDIDAQYGIKKRKKKQSAFVKTKVKRWRQGLRKRKDNGEEDEPEQATMYEEPKPMDGDDNRVMRSARHSDSTLSLTSTRPSDAPTSQESPTTTQESPDSHPTDETRVDTPEVPEPPPAFFGLPAYRPASVRSYDMHDASGSSGPSRPAPTRTRSSPEYEDDQPRHGTDKVTAPGYYPAPATEDSEAALAVVQRSDGKSGLPRPSSPAPSEETRRAHVATDDKQVLERMRLGGSAPFAPLPEMEDGSAPHVDVDADGFERMHLEPEIESGPSTKPRQLDHLPEPPQRKETRFYVSSGSGTADTLHLLPSAPPMAEDVDEYSGPSAPPMIEDEMPSAPPEEDSPSEVDLPKGADGDTMALGEADTRPARSRPASVRSVRTHQSDSDLYD